jgi:hypothetical protein
MQNAVVRAVQGELAHYPGVDMELRNGGKHQRATFFKDGESRFLTLPLSPSDWRAGKNALRDFRKTMRELGAERLDILPGQTKGRRTHAAPAGMAMNAKALNITIPGKSRLIRYFKTADNKPAAVWQIEIRASADLQAPPLLVVKKTQLPPGFDKRAGFVRGNLIPSSGGWMLTMGRTQVKALSKMVDIIKPVDLELASESDRELVFKIPTGVLPTKFKPRIVPKDEAPLPSQAWQEKAPLDDAPHLTPELAERAEIAKGGQVVRPAAPALSPDQPLGPLYLQMPKPTVSVEQALNVLNKAKQRLGSNLRFTVTEGGFLTATHRIGY